MTTEYRPDAALALLVPAEMTQLDETTEDFDLRPGRGDGASLRPTPADGDRLETTARYSGFHYVAPASEP